ncbi:MAG: methyltransferase domain-containing protein [Acidobacteriota bacterium]
MSLFVPRRVESEEVLDEGNAPRLDMERSLRDLQRFNSIFGGTPVYRRLVKAAADGAGSVLDLGTGTSDLLSSLHGAAILRIGLDCKIDHLLYGRTLRAGSSPRVHLVVGDGFSLPFGNGTVDLVTSSHFFHHFSPDENKAMLQESLRVARRAVVVSDTLRHIGPLLLVRVLGVLRLIGRVTRLDGPASVLQGYTVAEVRRIAEGVKARRKEVRRLFPYRFGLLLWK